VLAVLAALGFGALIGLFNGFTITHRDPVVRGDLAVRWRWSVTALCAKNGTVNLGDNLFSAGVLLPRLGIIAVWRLCSRSRSRFWTPRRLKAVCPWGRCVRWSFASRRWRYSRPGVRGQQDRGPPLIVLFGWRLVHMRNTRWAAIFASANAEAARRAGIKINNVRIIVFMLIVAAAAGGVWPHRV
jgi:hypothetical protein